MLLGKVRVRVRVSPSPNPNPNPNPNPSPNPNPNPDPDPDLGQGGATINAVQKESGALLDMQKKADEGSSVQAAMVRVRVRVRVRVPVSLVSPNPNPNPNPSQAVTIRGNAAQVKRAQAALEAVLKYDAESNAVLVVDAEP